MKTKKIIRSKYFSAFGWFKSAWLILRKQLALTKFGRCLPIQLTSIVLISTGKEAVEGAVAELFWQS